MTRTMTRSIASVLIAGALAVGVASSVTPSFARGGGGGGHGGGGPVFQGGGGGFHGGGGGGLGFRGAPSGGFASGGNFSGNLSSGTGHAAPDAIRPGRGIGNRQYAHDGGHWRHYGNGGYDGYLGGDGWSYGYNPYCSPYWLSVNPNLCYNGS